MTLRASKPAFNVREKLTELGRRFGLKGSELAAAETTQEAGALLGVGRRNFIMNPKFDIDQRSGGSQINHTSGSQNLIDRWSTYTNLSNHSSNYDIVNDAPVDSGIYRSVRITAAAASTYSTNQEYQFRQKFEGYDVKRLGWGTTGAKYSTVSFWVKSSIPGKYGLTAFFFGASSADRRFVGEYHINSANTWEYKTVTIPPLTESINQVNYEANASGMLMWSLGAHSNYQGKPGKWYSTYKVDPTGSVPFFATNGATFYLTGVQWELGKVATQLEHRSYGEELQLCKRYYQRWNGNDPDFNTYDSGGNRSGLTSVARATLIAQGVVHDSDDANVSMMLDVEMRDNPTVILPSGNNSIRLMVGSAIYDNATYVQENNCSRNILSIFVDNGGAMTASQSASLILKDTNSYIALDAEI